MTLSFFEKFSEHLQKTPDRTAFLHLIGSDREAYSYARLGKEIRAISLYLSRAGIGKGHKVGIIMENHPRWGAAFLAAQSAGATVVPLDILHSVDTLSHLVNHSECSFLFGSEGTLPLLQSIQDTRENPLPAVIAGSANGAYPDWDEIVDTTPTAEIPLPLVERDLNDPYIIMYTSGTTGNPKGVILSGRSLYRNVVEALQEIQIKSSDNFLNVLPLYHILALVVNFIIPLYCGAQTTFLDVLEPQKILQTFRKEGVTAFACVPQFYYLLHRRIFQEISQQGWIKQFIFNRLFGISRFFNMQFKRNLGKTFFARVHEPFGEKLRLLAVGGARFDIEVAQGLRDLGFTLIQAYGLTETSAFSTVTPVSEGADGSVGRPLPHVEIRIADKNVEGIGEVWIRGDHVMDGYFKNESATAESIDSEGWFHSGDLGYVTDDGALYITGRMKDVIVLSSGKNIYPEEIEQFYEKHCRYIKEMCVVGIKDTASENVQERLHAVIVPDFDYLKSKQVVNAYEMIRYLIETLSQQLPTHKRVHSLEIRKEPLPRTTTRKIKRFQLEKELRDGISERDDETVEEWIPSDETERQVVALIGHIKKDTPIRPEMNLELDIGLDSLERVEFLSNVQEQFLFELSDSEATEMFTLQDVIDVVRSRLSQDTGRIGKQKTWAEILEEPLSETDAQMVKGTLRRRPFVEFIFVLVVKLDFLVTKILFRLKGEGLENLPKDYPFMICPNHLSFLDAFVVAALLPPRVIRRFFALGYADYFATGLTAFLGKLVKTVPVDPDRKLREALRVAAEGLNNDLVLCVFPEGERSIDGTLKVFRKGPAILATTLKIPVVPVGIEGSYEVWRRGSNKIRFLPIRIRFGEPIRALDDESIEEFNSRLFNAVKQLT